MNETHFQYPIEVRYSDLDPQGHVNNACYLTYFEQARIQYIKHAGIWQGGSFLNLGIIVATAQVNFLAPVLFGQKIMVGVCVIRLGNKSLQMEYSMLDMDTKQELANGSTILVAYDYHTKKTVPIPEDWRQAIIKIEGKPL